MLTDFVLRLISLTTLGSFPLQGMYLDPGTYYIVVDGFSDGLVGDLH